MLSRAMYKNNLMQNLLQIFLNAKKNLWFWLISYVIYKDVNETIWSWVIYEENHWMKDLSKDQSQRSIMLLEFFKIFNPSICILMQFVCIVRFDWLLLCIKFSI